MATAERREVQVAPGPGCPGSMVVQDPGTGGRVQATRDEPATVSATPNELRRLQRMGMVVPEPGPSKGARRGTSSGGSTTAQAERTKGADRPSGREE